MAISKITLFEKVLSPEKLNDLEVYLNELQGNELEMQWLISENHEKNIPLHDENDHEYNMQKLDLQTCIQNLNWEYWIQDKIFDYQLKELIETYLLNLDLVNNLMKNHMILLRMKTNNSYLNYYKTKAHKVIENKKMDYNDLNKSLQLNEDYELLKSVCENNPYMILLNTYKYYLNIIRIRKKNIKKFHWLIAEQSLLISTPIWLDISTFDSLKDWEDSIITKN